MNHKITIKDLGPIKEIKDFEVKNINAVIGESAAGKSLLAKAIYVFNEPNFVEMLTQGVPIAKRRLLFNIRRFLGPYKNFKITYNYSNDYSIRITYPKNVVQDSIMVLFSKKLKEDITKVKTEIKQIQANERTKFLEASWAKLKKSNQKNYQRLLEETMNDLDEISEDSDYSENSSELKDNFLSNLNIMNTIFIPATRAFLFDFNDIMNYIKINRHRDVHGRYGRYGGLPSPSDNDVTLNIFSYIYRTYVRKFDRLTHKLMRGSVKKVSGTTLKFTVGNQVLDMSEISSGQKGLFPILMILQIIEKEKTPYFIIIEEPEAHLFPTDQKLLLDRIIEFANNTQSKIFLTTHAPYILMTMNNLIEANTSDYKKFKNKYINFNEINMQILEKGTSKSILDNEDKLIDLDYIEKIENEIIEEFQRILHANNDK